MVWIINKCIRLYYKLKFKVDVNHRGKYYGEIGIDYLSEPEMADTIAYSIRNKKPLCVGKIGGNELNALLANEIGDDSFKKLAYDRLCEFAGFFPRIYKEKTLEKYCYIQLKAVTAIDLLVHYEKECEEYVLKNYKNSSLRWVDTVGSWEQDIPWTKELKGQKVVVVHPFAELIEEQYKKREQIYPNSDVLPEFDLRVIKAVQTIAGSTDARFETWFEALDYMYQEIMKEDFDIALIGCGAYGLPLAAKVKEAGKIGVHMGGDLQMLFGIRGKRWDDRERAKRWYNDAWVRPGEEYKVNGFDSVEDGCYW